jgi:hypothetical protein
MCKKKVVTFTEFQEMMKRLEGCVVETISTDRYDNGVTCITITDGVTSYKFWTPVMDNDILGTVPLGVEQFVDDEPIEIEIGQ